MKIEFSDGTGIEYPLVGGTGKIPQEPTPPEIV
jgi:hypothetical protein